MTSKQSVDLQGDGLVENLFHFIWSKDCLFKSGPQILIPDTIIYRFEQPAFWYFSRKSDYTILRKNKKNLSNKQIEEAFLKKVSPSGIVAVYIYNKTERNIVNVMNRQQKIRINEAQQENDIEQDDEVANLNYQGLSIHQRNKSNQSHGQGMQDNEQYDAQQDELLRDTSNVETFFEYFDKENFFPLRGSHLPQKLQTMANSISQHISNVTFEKIRPNRMVLNFKIDKDDRIWLLWCSSLRIEGKTYKANEIKIMDKSIPKNQTLNALPLKIEHKPQLPSNIRHGQTHSSKAPTNLHRESKCLSCNFMMEPDRIVQSAHDMRKTGDDFRTTQNWVQKLLNKDIPKIKTLIIPFIIKQLYPQMTVQQYQELKEDINYQNQTTFVCEECFLCISMASECSGVKFKIPKPIKKVVLKRQEPEKIHQRRNITNVRIQGIQNQQRSNSETKHRNITQLDNYATSQSQKMFQNKDLDEFIDDKINIERIEKTFKTPKYASNNSNSNIFFQRESHNKSRSLNRDFNFSTSLDDFSRAEIQQTRINLELENIHDNIHDEETSDDIQPVRMEMPLIIKHKDGRPPAMINKDKMRVIASKNRELLRHKIEKIKTREEQEREQQASQTFTTKKNINSISSLATSVSESPYFKEMYKYRKKINLGGLLSNKSHNVIRMTEVMTNLMPPIESSQIQEPKQTISQTLSDDQFHLPTI
eukprot:403351049